MPKMLSFTIKKDQNYPGTLYAKSNTMVVAILVISVFYLFVALVFCLALAKAASRAEAVLDNSSSASALVERVCPTYSETTRLSSPAPSPPLYAEPAVVSQKGL